MTNSEVDTDQGAAVGSGRPLATSRVRILVWYGAGGDPATVTATYHQVSQVLAGAEGLLGNELLRLTADPDRFVVMSEWASLAAFRAWDATAAHLLTLPLREFGVANGDGRHYELYEVVDAYAYEPARDRR